MKRLSPVYPWLVICLCAFAFAMSAILSRTVFDRLPHLEDEMAYLFQARTIAGGHLVIDSPQPRQAYWQPFVVDLNGTRFGKYTPGWPAQLALGVLLGQAWVINALAAAVVVALVYRLGREVFNPETGVIAAALVAFSPMALLLNATLMGHTVALLWTTLFLYAYWRLERGGRRTLAWGALAGLSLGLLVASRPATGLAVAVPFVAWSGIRLLRGLARAIEARFSPASRRAFINMLTPLIMLGAVALLLTLSVPLYNYEATGNPSRNLYTLVWDYDRLGFGEGYGRHGHTLEKGVRQARFDLSLTAADLFGWQIDRASPDNTLSAWRLEPLIAPVSATRPDLFDHFVNQADYYPALGLSWVLLPLGLLIAFRWRSIGVLLWLAVGAGWLALPFAVGGGALTRDPAYSWIAILGLLVWLCAPLLVMRRRETVWPWLILSTALALIIIQLAYWIGSQRYSTRYYYEGLTAAALFSALPIAWLLRRLRARIVKFVLAALVSAVLAYSLFYYSLPRVGVLKDFNFINRQLIDAVNARRDGDRPVLVIITGDDVRWRSYAPIMAETSPYLDSPIVAARVSNIIPRAQVVARFPDRQIIEMNAQGNSAWFADEPPPEVIR